MPAKRSEEHLWAEYLGSSRAVGPRNRIVETYLPLVRQIAHAVWKKLAPSVEEDDLISAGVFGLMDAIAAFDIGGRFSLPLSRSGGSAVR